VQTVVNRILEGIKDHSEASEWVMEQAEQSIERQIRRVDDAANSARAVEGKIAEVEGKLTVSCQQNERAAAKFRETAEVLDRIIEEHARVQHDFAIIKNRMDSERKGNIILFALVVILALLLVVKFLRFKRA
jgi:molecular chaperone GrpE (heat shock protein)